MNSIYVIICLMCVTVPLLIRAEFALNQKQKMIFKPLSSTLMVLIALLSIVSGEGVSAYQYAILAGLLFCFGGDMALMFSSQKAFRVGLVLFLTGHVVYALAISHYNGFWVKEAWITGAVSIVGVLLYLYLFSGLGNMKLSVLIYVVVISVMLNSAVQTNYGAYFDSTQVVRLSVGAGLFYVSDVILAVNRFKISFKYNRISLAFYFGGQVLIALSTW